MIKKKHRLFGFIKSLHRIHSRASTMYAYQKDNRITSKEKQILDSWQLLRQNKFDEIIQTLELPVLDNEPVEAQRLLILGIVYNNKTEFSDSINYLERSITLLEKYEDDSSIFTAYYNLFISYHNAKNESGLIKTIARLEEFPTTNETRKILLHLCLFNYHAYFNKFDEAEKIYFILAKMKIHMTDSVLMAYLFSGFSFFVKIQNFDRCEEILLQLKDKKIFNSGAYYKSMKLLLNNLKDDKPIYAYKEHFEEFPHIFQQLMTIQHLESGQIEQAQTYWNQLQSMYPEIYFKNFEYRGDLNLFSLCLEKYKPHLNSSSQNIDQLSKEEAILTVLTNSKQWLSRDELYRKVWGKDWEEKIELSRLHKYIAILRSKGFKILFKKSAYKLESIGNVKIKKVS